MEIISLGSDCCVTYQLQKYGFRTLAYPFDWLRCSLLDAIRLIGNKFEDILDDIYFTRTSTNFKFTTLDNNNSEIKPIELGYIYKSKRYDSLEFCHDFRDDHLGNLPEVSAKFSRRSIRFLHAFQNKPCSFIHYTTKPITKETLQLWEFSISKPLYVISPLPKEALIVDFSNDMNYKFITFIQDINEYVSWHRDSFDWLKLFTNITNHYKYS